LGLTPLDIYIKEVALTTMFRFGTVGIESSVGVGLQRACIWKEATNSFPLLEVLEWTLQCHYLLSANPTQSNGRYWQQLNMSGVINIYTGSKTKISSGCGIYSKSLKP